MHPVQIPTLGESINEGVIVRWIKGDGEAVALDEPLLELETDKASVEIPSPAAGVLHHQHAEGDTVQVGEAVAQIDPDGVATSAGSSAVAPQESAAAATGDRQAAAPTPAAAPAAPTKASGAASADSAAEKAPDNQKAVTLSPAVRRLVEEHDLDPGTIKGSGRSGRITKADVLKHLQETDKPADAGGQAPARKADDSREPRPPTPYPPEGGPGEPAAQDERQPMSRLRLRIAERLLQAQREAAILTTFNEVDMSSVMALRSRFKEEFEKKHGVRLGFMSFFARACIAAMQDVPLVNARIEGTDVVQPRSINLAVAVGTDRGLVVPVVHDADRMSFAELEERIGQLADLAQRNKLSIADLSGGTFTISNGGVYGSLLSTPILNPPQSGILGMHKIEKRPVVVDDEVVVRPMMYLALSYDHRLIDGSEAVTFLVRVKERIETPERLLFDL